MTQLKNLFLLLILVVLFISCTDQQHQDSFKQKVSTLRSFKILPDTIRTDSLIRIEEIDFNKDQLKRLSISQIKKAEISSQIQEAKSPVIIEFLPNTPSIPGQNGNKSIIIHKVQDSIFLAGATEKEKAKDAYIKVENPQCFSSYSTLQGLVDNNIRDLDIDEYGNLWFATSSNLIKFDGRDFTYLTREAGIVTNTIQTMLIDRDGNIWVASFGGGLCKYDGKYISRYGKNQGLPSSEIIVIYEDKAGNIWAGTQFDGAIKYDGSTFTHLSPESGLIKARINGISEDEFGNIWFATDQGLSKFDGQKFQNYIFPNPEEKGRNIQFNCALTDNQNKLWFGSYQGLFKYQDEVFVNYKKEHGLIANSIISMYQSKSGDLWLGTFKGLSQFDGKNFNNYSKKEGLLDNFISGIKEDKKGTIWIATSQGLCKFKPQQFEHFTDKENLFDDYGNVVLEDTKGNFWFGSQRNGLVKKDSTHYNYFDESTGFISNMIHDLDEDKEGNIWISTYKGLAKYDGENFFYLNKESGLLDNHVIKLVIDSTDTKWIFTLKGFTKFDEGKFTHYHYSQRLQSEFSWDVFFNNKDDIWIQTGYNGLYNFTGKQFIHYSDEVELNTSIRSLLKDKNGHLWFCIEGKGAFKYDGQNFTQYSMDEGMYSEDIRSIYEDKKGNIWFGSYLGLSVLPFDKTQHTSYSAKNLIKTYTYEDGFYGLFASHFMEDSKGSIWMGCHDRFTKSNPKRLLVDDTIAPNIQISSLDLFGQKLIWNNLEKNQDSLITLANGVQIKDFSFSGTSRWYSLPKDLSLAYFNNNVTFNYIGIEHHKNSQVQYSYILEGIDKDWSNPSNREAAAYGNLEHGSYTFKVKAMNSEGHWSPTASYSFNIRPPFWKTWYFRTASLLLIVFSVIAYVKRREHLLKKRQKELENTVTERTSELREEKKEVEKQKNRSDELLLNILPAKVAEELKEKGSSDAKLMDDVTVLFTDFKGFTTMSEILSPKELVRDIHECFSAFDRICERYGVEKIKTIGDAYMAAGGLPSVNSTHPEDIVKVAFEIRDFVEQGKKDKIKAGLPYFEIRIGIHTGPVVAGIVGIKKFQYDIWGDTVNTASRMESSGEVGKINISQNTYDLLKDKNIYHFESRGKVQAKGKGDLEMFFVEMNEG